MRILTVCSNWRVFGAETITLKMLEGFKRCGHEQMAVASTWSDGEFSLRLRSIGIPEALMPLAAVALPKSLRMIKYTLHTSIYLPILWWRWHQVMHAFKPDIVIWTSTKQALLLLPWLDKTPSFVVEHTNVQPSRGNAWLYGILGRKLSGFVAVSEFMRGHLERVGAPPGKISVVRNGAIFQANDLKKDAKLHGTRAPLNEGTKIRLG